MSKVAVVSHLQFPTDRWWPAIDKGLDMLKARGVEGVRVLGDSVPAAASWVSSPLRNKSGLKFELVVTDWTAATPYIARNEKMLDGTDYVVVLGTLANRSATEFFKRAAEQKGMHLVQIDEDGAAKVVGTENVAVTEAMKQHLKTPAKPVTEGEAEGWKKYMAAPAKPAKGTKK